jgi:hypothetical protein
VNESDWPRLRRMAREIGVSPAALRDAVECGLFVDDESPAAWASELRRMRRMMDHLGVNAPGAALVIRMHHELAAMQRQLQRLSRLEAGWFEDWDEGHWHDLSS